MKNKDFRLFSYDWLISSKIKSVSPLNAGMLGTTRAVWKLKAFCKTEILRLQIYSLADIVDLLNE